MWVTVMSLPWSGTLDKAGFARLSLLKPVLDPAHLLEIDLSRLSGAPTRIETVELISTSASTQYYKVRAYVAPAVRFELRLPMIGWAQRLLMFGVGGYGGTVSFDFDYWPGIQSALRNLPLEHFALVTTDLGHQRSLAKENDALWALSNPQALVDFGYAATHKVVVASKKIIELFYGIAPTYSYLVGTSNGGRQGLQEAQRYPEDFHGIACDAPTLDYVATATFWHAWNAQTNRGKDGKPILTADKIPGLHNAVLRAANRAGAVIEGMVVDPRAFKFDANELLGSDFDNGFTITEAQADVINRLYQGPITPSGERLFPGGMTYGSELAWIGGMVPAHDEPLSEANCLDISWCQGFPDHMSSFDSPTGIDWSNLRFDAEHFARMHELSGIYDPTNPDLRAFREAGGKILIWQGWADTLTSPNAVLNYYAAVGRFMGSATAASFLKLYLVPGVYHCGRGPTNSWSDYLTPLMQWVEGGVEPEEISVKYGGDVSDFKFEKKLSAFPYPSMARQVRVNEPNNAATVKGGAQLATTEHISWLGDQHTLPTHTLWGRMVRGRIELTKYQPHDGNGAADSNI